MRRRATAGPCGSRLPCSHSWRVLTLTPIRPANADCDMSNFSLITLGGEGSESSCVRRANLPFLNCLISLIPSRISAPRSLSPIFDCLRSFPSPLVPTELYEHHPNL